METENQKGDEAFKGSWAPNQCEHKGCDGPPRRQGRAESGVHAKSAEWDEPENQESTEPPSGQETGEHEQKALVAPGESGSSVATHRGNQERAVGQKTCNTGRENRVNERFEQYKAKHAGGTPQPSEECECQFGPVLARFHNLFHWARHELQTCECKDSHSKEIAKQANELLRLVPATPSAESLMAVFLMLKAINDKVEKLAAEGPEKS